MTIRTALSMAIFTFILMACSSTGPIKFYSGPQQPNDKLAIVIVPAAITVLSIDGQSVNSPSILSGTYQVQLSPGFHLISFRYELFWGAQDTGILVKSKEVGVDTTFTAGSTYEIQYKVPQNARQANEYFFHFKATLVDMSTGKQSASYNIENLGATVVARKQQAMEAEQQASSPAPTLSAEAAANADPVKRLKFWWLLADPQQRKAFTDWMKTANESFAPDAKSAPASTTAPAPQNNSSPDTINGVKLKP
ncbi:MAG: DUF2057 domain-containing protein [Gammaproteobacteria bacterium]|nr:DUF2057 domain-containing protein [Gammaproteobacteria bacterium]